MQTINRIPILYIILGVLLLVGVVPLYFYSTQVVAINRDRLKTNEQLLQNTVTRSLSEDIYQKQSQLSTLLNNLSSSVLIASGGNLSSDRINFPELRAILESFVSSSSNLAYATLLNFEAKGISAGRVVPDIFLQRELEHAFAAARVSRAYNGQALSAGAGKESKTLMVVSIPITINGAFAGMVAAVVDLQYLVNRLNEQSKGGLDIYVVDHHGRLVAAASNKYATGQDMNNIEIVKSFSEQEGEKNFVVTSEFTMRVNNRTVDMLGTYSPVATLDWAVIAQKTRQDAYQSVNEMQRSAQVLALLAVLISVAVSIFAARKITDPLRTLTASSRAIAKGDFSHRVKLKSRTEIGELAETFNSMSSDLERFVSDLKHAAEQNRTLFLSSIQMLAGAVDEKDPYTRGHSDRVTRYSVLLAKEMTLSEEEIERVRIAAQLHDVGKIGIEDRILKKPGALTPDEFEIMKQHTTKGASILRPVTALKDMIPGIELHHEALDGRGYPHGLKGDQLPLLPRIIMVADTFDAMTTNRPYQAAMDPEYVVRIINSMSQTKFDPRVVAAITSVFQRGGLRLHRAATLTVEQAEAAAASAEDGAVRIEQSSS